MYLLELASPGKVSAGAGAWFLYLVSSICCSCGFRLSKWLQEREPGSFHVPSQAVTSPGQVSGGAGVWLMCLLKLWPRLDTGQVVSGAGARFVYLLELWPHLAW